MSGVRTNKSIDDVEGKYKEEAIKICEEIRAGKMIAGKQGLGSIIAD